MDIQVEEFSPKENINGVKEIKKEESKESSDTDEEDTLIINNEK